MSDTLRNVPLVQAINERNKFKAIFLIRAGAKVNQITANIPGYFGTPLLSLAIRAIRFSGKEVALEILNREDFLEWNKMDPCGNSPLEDAVTIGSGQIVAKLLEKGARLAPNKKMNYQNLTHLTALEYAKEKNWPNIVKLLEESISE